MRYLLFFCLILCISNVGLAQYATPGTGVHWDLDSLILHSAGVVTAGLSEYQIHEDLTIAGGDSLSTVSQSIALDPNVTLIIEGYVNIGGFETVIISADPDNIYTGIEIAENAEAYFDSVLFDGGGGVSCETGDVEFTHCTFQSVQHIITANAALQLYTGRPYIDQCVFENSLGPAIASFANVACAPQILNSTFIGNVSDNSNWAQLSLGGSGSQFATQFVNNLILGDASLTQVAGISFYADTEEMSEIYIQNNTIQNNRSGIFAGGINYFYHIEGNTIEFNNLGTASSIDYSGIYLHGSANCSAELSYNTLRQNHGGVAVGGSISVDLGQIGNDEGSPGFNVFSDNGYGGVTNALYNNTALPISAQNNCWIEGQQSTPAEIEDVVFHETDDPTFGLVNYSNYLCALPNGLEELSQNEVSLHPNPCNEILFIDNGLHSYWSGRIVSVTGTNVDIPFEEVNSSRLDVSVLTPGVYFLELTTKQSVIRTPFIKR